LSDWFSYPPAIGPGFRVRAALAWSRGLRFRNTV